MAQFKDVTDKPFGKSLRVFQTSREVIDTLFNKGYYEIPKKATSFYPNQPLVLKNGQQSAMAFVDKWGDRIVLTKDDVGFWGIGGRNKEQILLQHLMKDPEIRCIIVTGPAGTGKAQPLDAKIMTPDGWKLMGDMEAGDQVMTPAGTPASVTGVYPQGSKEIYRVYFQDGSSTECCKEHLWYTTTCLDRDKGRPGSVKNLEEIMSTLKYRGKRNHQIPVTQPLQLEESEVPLDPYLVGCLLGDGYVWSKEDLKEVSVKDALLRLKTSEDKHIPHRYLFGSYQQRLALLRGLMDTDGAISKDGKNITFTTASSDMVEDFKTLVQSIGGTVSVSERTTERKGEVSYRCTLSIPNEINPFHLPRKANRVKPRTKCHPRRIIDRVEYVGRREAQCIKVDHPEHLYLTDDMVATHNTTLIGSYALAQVLEFNNFGKMLLSKPLEIATRTRYWGTMPGDEDEKFGPFLKSYQIMFENMSGGKQGESFFKAAVDKGEIDFMPLELMRGATLRDAIVWYDEAQNLNHKEMQTLGSRLDDRGQSKLILSGDLGQRDRRIDREKTGLMKLATSNHFLNSSFTAHVDLVQNERGELSQLFYDVFDDGE